MFDKLTGLFVRVGLKTNAKETVRMVYHPCQAARIQSDEAYTRQMTGVGRC